MERPNLQIEIRSAIYGDLERLCELWQQLMELHAELDPIFTPARDGRDHYRRWLRYHLDEPDSQVIIAEAEGRVAGYILAQVQTIPPVMRFRRIGFISDMVVDAAWRNCGVGRAMVRELEHRMRDLGIERLELKSSSRNPQANHFWEKVCGFEEFVKVRCKPLK
ncbi:MAG: GNAT family N-acetyltransferase [Myxococcales bacterium]|nr:MAG: GNAT family N-acetyltransferase [Myxococcales bacterium]